LNVIESRSLLEARVIILPLKDGAPFFGMKA